MAGPTPEPSHQPPIGAPGSIAAASATAPAAFSAPAPAVSVSEPGIANEVYSRIAFTAFGESGGLNRCAARPASSISATVPLTTPADMLVPLSLMNGLPPTITMPPGYVEASVLGTLRSETSFEPGATRSGFWKPSNHVGPRELYQATVSSPRGAGLVHVERADGDRRPARCRAT